MSQGYLETSSAALPSTLLNHLLSWAGAMCLRNLWDLPFIDFLVIGTKFRKAQAGINIFTASYVGQNLLAYEPQLLLFVPWSAVIQSQVPESYYMYIVGWSSRSKQTCTMHGDAWIHRIARKKLLLVMEAYPWQYMRVFLWPLNASRVHQLTWLGTASLN